ncbi:Hypothetical protein PHPALM_1963 [Phytophthora palmivora]|uniref:DUF6570 domain-containing protein n=1 Tax=Phytophthora palmivora TaxID=4796 RepID=A0A2P4YQZ7_9STRA|nr:Hypothetical protein PHPALM_1963 [Phytophthora palmivora]
MDERDRLIELAKSKRRQLELSELGSQSVSAVNHLLKSYRAIKDRVYKQSAKLLSAEAMMELVCGVCDCLHPAKRIKGVNIDTCAAFWNAMATRLKPPPDIPHNLRDYYDASELDPRTNPPKFAIANGLYMGRLPTDLEDSTITENAMLNLAQPMHYMSVVRGGKHASLRSHVYFFRADPTPPAHMLPVDIVSEAIFGVSMVGALTPMQKTSTTKKYDVRVSRLKEQLLWYKTNNRLYANIEEHANWETTIEGMSTRIVVDRSEISLDENVINNPPPTEVVECRPNGFDTSQRECDVTNSIQTWHPVMKNASI